MNRASYTPVPYTYAGVRMEGSEKNPSRLKTVHMHHAHASRTCHAQDVRLGKIISPLLHKAQPHFPAGPFHPGSSYALSFREELFSVIQ